MMSSRTRRSGQIMLLAIIVLSTGILAAGTVAGTLVLMRVRQSISVRESTVAIHSADAGLECELYRQFQDPTFNCEDSPLIDKYTDAKGDYWELPNGSRYRISRIPDPVTGFEVIRSVGEFNRATRAFETQFVLITECNDGVDNDGDGFMDYAPPVGFSPDPECDSPTDLSELVGSATVECNDGLDNDGDGFIDYPDDPGCLAVTDNDEYNASVTQCSDGIDNSDPEDVYADFPADCGCIAASDPDELNNLPFECCDSVDNDGDGFIDYPDDPDCTSGNDNTEAGPPPPTANIYANGTAGSITISSGGSATITWDSTNAASCDVSDSGGVLWTGLTGNQNTGSLTSSETYTLTCTGAGGTVADTVTVNVSGVPAVNIYANGSGGSITINYNTAANITWDSSGVSSCAVSPTGWSGTSEPSGRTTSNLTGLQTYTIDCDGGAATDSVTVRVYCETMGACTSPISYDGLTCYVDSGSCVQPPSSVLQSRCENGDDLSIDTDDGICGSVASPIADIKADSSDGPINIPYNSAATISWSSTGALDCYVRENGTLRWTGTADSGQDTGPLTSDMTYRISCDDTSGITYPNLDSVTVNLDPIVTGYRCNYYPACGFGTVQATAAQCASLPGCTTGDCEVWYFDDVGGADDVYYCNDDPSPICNKSFIGLTACQSSGCSLCDWSPPSSCQDDPSDGVGYCEN